MPDITDFFESIVTLAHSAKNELDAEEIREILDLIRGDLQAIEKILDETEKQEEA